MTNGSPVLKPSLLPRYHFPDHPPSLWAMAMRGMSDTASIIPRSILWEPAVQLPGPRAPLIVADPDLIRQVLIDRVGDFTRDRLMQRLMRRAWGNGIAAAQGEDWQQQRRAAAPAFRPQAVAQNCAAFAKAAGDVCLTITPEKPLELTGLVARIIAAILFSVLIEGADAVDSDAIARDMPDYIRRIAAFGPIDMLPLPENVIDRLHGIPDDPVVQRLHKLAAELAADKPWNGKGMIARLKGIGPLQDNILGLFPAAMDTTVSGVSWTLFTLAQCPEWQEKIAEEARACAGSYTLENLPLTRNAVQEVLRLYPPAPLLVRTAAQDMALGGYPLRAGQTVALSIYAMHRHQTHWEEPDTFNPARFGQSSAHYPAYLPFGAGPRVCIAAQFALSEITVVVARLLADFALLPSDCVPEIQLQVTTRSKNGLIVIPQLRSDS